MYDEEQPRDDGDFGDAQQEEEFRAQQEEAQKKDEWWQVPGASLAGEYMVKGLKD